MSFDQSHRGTDRPNARVDITDLVHPVVSYACDEILHVTELTALFEDLHDLAHTALPPPARKPSNPASTFDAR
jgi:hypothetical protein